MPTAALTTTVPIARQSYPSCRRLAAAGRVTAAAAQLVIDDEFGPLGAGGTRALCTAIMGAVPGPGTIPHPFKLINSLRLWRCNVGDDGACSLAEVGGDRSIVARRRRDWPSPPPLRTPNSTTLNRSLARARRSCCGSAAPTS